MKKVVLAVLLAMSSSVALASEVGAQNSQLAASILELAVAESGASISWAEVPYRSTANAHQLAKMKSQIAVFNQSMNSDLEAAIEQKLLSSLEY